MKTYEKKKKKVPSYIKTSTCKYIYLVIYMCTSGKTNLIFGKYCTSYKVDTKGNSCTKCIGFESKKGTSYKGV